MIVKLIECTPNPENVVATAAKNCYSDSSVEEIQNGLTEEKVEKFIDMLSELGHDSPLEHACFTFHIGDVSRSLLAQLTRHRLASYSVRSQRYVREDAFEYIVPPAIAEIPEALELFETTMRIDQGAYDRLTELLAEKHEDEMLAQGVPEDKARRLAEKRAIEDARYVFPNACTTQLIMTMNARELKTFFRLRCCNRAQWEIRELADKMLVLCRQVAPSLFKNAGAPCEYGACPEGKMSCGQPRRRDADGI